MNLFYLIALNGYFAYKNLLNFPRSEAAEAEWQNLIHPKAGDLVLEISNLRWKRYQASPEAALGILLQQTEEPVSTPEEWEDDRPIPNEPVFYLKPLDPAVPHERIRWTNCDFIKVRTDDKEPEDAYATSPGNAGSSAT